MRVIDELNMIKDRLDLIENHLLGLAEPKEKFWKVGQIISLKNGKADFMLAACSQNMVCAVAIRDDEMNDIGNRYRDAFRVTDSYKITKQELSRIIDLDEFNV